MSKAHAQSAIVTALTALIGRHVLATAAGATDEHRFKVAKVDTKMGKMKNGEPAPYVILTRDDDESVLINLHPKKAKSLIDDGVVESDGQNLTLVALPIAEGSAEPEAGVSAPTTEDTSTGTAQAGTTTEGDGTATTTTASDAAPEPTAAPSKKDVCVDLYISMANEEKSRAEIIAAFIEKTGISKACANTYYQNCRSYKDGWTVDPSAVEASDEEGGTEGGEAAASTEPAGTDA